jgi:hypothetical protein
VPSPSPWTRELPRRTASPINHPSFPPLAHRSPTSLGLPRCPPLTPHWSPPSPPSSPLWPPSRTTNAPCPSFGEQERAGPGLDHSWAGPTHRVFFMAAAHRHPLALGAPSVVPESPHASGLDAADSIATLHAQAAGVHNIRSLASVVLDPTSSQYPRWHAQVVLTLRWFALADHVLDDPTPNFALYSAAPPTTTFTCLAVHTILTLPPPLPISYLLVPPATSSLATPLTTRGIAVLTSPPTASLSPVTSSSTKMCFPLLAPLHPSISTLSLSPIRLLLHPRRLALRHCPLHAWLRRLRARLFPCLVRSRRPRLRHAWPRRLHSHLYPCHAWPHRLRPRRRA